MDSKPLKGIKLHRPNRVKYDEQHLPKQFGQISHYNIKPTLFN